MRGAILAAALLAACHLTGTPALDGGPDGDTGSDSGAADASDDVDGEAGPACETGPGPLSLVAAGFEVVTDRICDLDGDGLPDNSVAALGTPGSDIFANAVAALVQMQIDGGQRTIVQFPRVDDRRAPAGRNVRFFLGRGEDDDSILDLPGDLIERAADDLEGEEPFWLRASSLDPCGQPAHVATGIDIDESGVHGENVFLPTGLAGNVEGARLSGEIEPCGRAGRLTACGYLALAGIGQTPGLGDGHDLTLLEMFLSGGAAVGVAGLPGLAPDVDLDGDGLETVLLDDEGHVEQCIDGDTTVIDGPDCFLDPRIADAISLSLRLDLVGMRFMGRVPSFSVGHEGSCPDVPLCVEVCRDVEDCTPSSNANAFRLENLECDDGACVAVGCRADRATECSSQAGSSGLRDSDDYRCDTSSTPPTCRESCETAADCTGNGLRLDAERNWACDDGLCFWTGCRDDGDCSPDAEGAARGCLHDGDVGRCVRRCSSPADCARPTSPVYGEDNYLCEGRLCRWLGCVDDAECHEDFGREYACR